MRKSKKLKDGDLRPRKRQRKSLGGRWIKMWLEIGNYFGRRWVRRMEVRWNVEDISGTGKIEARRIWKTCFEDLYNIDTQEQLAVHICGFDEVRTASYLGGEPTRRTEIEVKVEKLKKGKLRMQIRSLVKGRSLRLECTRVLHETFLVHVLMYRKETMTWRDSEWFRIRGVQMEKLRGLVDIRTRDRIPTVLVRVLRGMKKEEVEERTEESF